MEERNVKHRNKCRDHKLRQAGGMVAAVLALGLTSGCITTDGGHDPVSRQTQITWAEFTHQVAFPVKQGRIGRSSANRLDVFLKKERVSGADRLFVVAQPNIANAKQDRLAARRESSVVAHLALRGFEAGVLPGNIAGPAVNTGGPDAVTLVVRRALVATPYCPDWGTLSAGSEMVGERSQFGCITTTALGAMVADPNDLVEGRDAGLVDGDAASKAIQRYRSGKVKKPGKPNTKKGS